MSSRVVYRLSGLSPLPYRLWDIDLLINRTLAICLGGRYRGTLTVSIIALYVLAVVGLGRLFQAQGNLAIALLATGLVAVLFQPWRHRLQRAVNRLLYGDRDEPYRVISRLGQRLEATLTPETVLPTIVETAAQALKLPYAAITLQQGEALAIAASYGSLQDAPLRLPLVYQNEAVGELMLAPRGPSERFTLADRVLRADLARQAGLLTLCIQDDGCSLPPPRGVGVDLVSMRERAEELGGTWTIEPVKSGGTRVLAQLPYALSETTDALVANRLV